jgi:hypothetical protein
MAQVIEKAGVPDPEPRVGVCFFGIVRNAPAVIGSIRRNVLGPAHMVGATRVYAHLFRQESIDNPRSNETGKVDLEGAALLGADELVWEDPDEFIHTPLWSEIQRRGDSWSDNWRSARNLLHQLRSLKAVTAMALRDGCDLVVFARPDLAYHDTLARPISRVMAAGPDSVALPWWQSWWGQNDRFCVARGRAAIRAYGERGDLVSRFMSETGHPLHSERLVDFALRKADINVLKVPTRASRVRLDGSIYAETFEPFVLTRLRDWLLQSPLGGPTRFTRKWRRKLSVYRERAQ